MRRYLALIALLATTILASCGGGGGGGGGTTDTTTPLTLTLLKKVTITTDAEGGSARSEIVATANRVFVVYLGNITAGGNRTFNAKVFDDSLQNLIASKTIVTTTTDYGSPTDIRLASDGQYLYAFYETA